jgi:hypothetical protein
MAQHSQPTALLPVREAITAPTVAKHRNTRTRLESFRLGAACRVAVCSTMAQAARITVATQTDQASQVAVRAFTAAYPDDGPLVAPGLAWEQLDPATRQEVLEDLVVEAVEDLEQRLHDTFVDTTWPACPRHRQHPLWLGKTTVAGPRGAARAMMRRSARWGIAGAAG